MQIARHVAHIFLNYDTRQITLKHNMSADKIYLDTLQNIRVNGVKKSNRTGVSTVSLFGSQMKFSLMGRTSNLPVLPILTTKKIYTKAVIHELLWFLSGDTNIKYLKDNNVRIWNEWADENGDLGPVYSEQWVKWPSFKKVRGVNYCDEVIYEKETINQIEWIQNRLRENPDCRRMIVSAWNVADLSKMALQPCHCLFQFYTSPMSLPERLEEANKRGIYIDYAWRNKEDGHADLTQRGVPERYLDCQLYQRSADFFLGVPFNILSYSILTIMMAQCVNMVPREFIWAGGDCHIYENHFDQVEEQLSRTPFVNETLLKLNEDVKDIFDFKYEDFEIQNYKSHGSIKAEVAV